MKRLLAGIALLAPLAAAQAAHAAPLRAGVGKADITPRTGYYLGGWMRQDRVAQGQHTRLWSRALVLQRGDRKAALVAVDLFMVPAGLVKHVGDALGSRASPSRTSWCRPPTPLLPRRVRKLQDLQHRGARPRHGHRPAQLLQAARLAAGRPSAVLVPRVPGDRRCAPRGR